MLSLYCNVEASELIEVLRRRIESGGDGGGIRKALTAAIQLRGVSPAQYKSLTGDNELTTDDAVTARLQESGIFSGAIIPSPESGHSST